MSFLSGATRLIRCLLLALVVAVLAAFPARAGQQGPLVLAASSLQESLTAAADAWAARGHPRPIISFAASSALARQIEAGAPADLFISADEDWMDRVAGKRLIRLNSRVDFLGNSLVLIAPATSKIRLRIAPGFGLARALGNGRLAMADPDTVPAGKYGKAALTRLGVWPKVRDRIVRAENVRAALVLVQRGEAPLGIVYATDARAAPGVRILGTFPENSHPAIRYPVAMLASSANPGAETFRRFLISRGSQAIFARFGFRAP